MNTIAFADQWVEEARATGSKDYAAARAEVQARATADTPINIGYIEHVVYNDKFDRYTIKFGEGSSAKVTNDVAQCLLTASGQHGVPPVAYAHMTDGTIDAVLLLYLSRLH